MAKLTTHDKNLMFYYIRQAIDLYEKGELSKSSILFKAWEWWKDDNSLRLE
jgi:hypothetical protein